MYLMKAACAVGVQMIRRVVELDEELIVREKFVVDFVGVLDVVDGEVILCRQMIQPDFGGYRRTAGECRRARRWRRRGIGLEFQVMDLTPRPCG